MTAIVIWCPSGEGHIVYTRQLTEALAALPVDERFEGTVTVLTTSPIPAEHVDVTFPIECVSAQVRQREEIGSTWRWFLDRVTYHPRREWALVRWLRQHPDCDIVHLQEIHEITGPLMAWIIRRVLRRRLVFTMHNVLSHRRRGRVARMLEIAWTRRLLVQADALIVHGQNLKKSLLELYRLPSDKVDVIPIAIPARAPMTVVARDSIVGSEPRILFYGSLRANKGLHHLLDCFAAAPHWWSLRVVGQIAEQDYFSAQLEPRIRLLQEAGRRIDFRPGYVPDPEVPGHFGWASVVALPYDGFDAQSGVLMDAIAHRIPVVVTPQGALAETVNEFGFGIVAASHTPVALETAIRACLALDPAALQAAWERATEGLSPRRMAERTSRVYTTLRGGAGDTTSGRARKPQSPRSCS